MSSGFRFGWNSLYGWHPPTWSRLFCCSMLMDAGSPPSSLKRSPLLAIPEICCHHSLLGLTESSALTLSRRNNKNSSLSFIRCIVMWALRVKVMAEIQRRIRFNTISMSVLMITIAVGVMTAMWMYADALVWILYTWLFCQFNRFSKKQ